MTQTVLVIGAGITGALCTSSLLKIIPNIKVKICDKARGVGGRMTTTRSNGLVTSQADLGAQYISTDRHLLEKYNFIYSNLLKHGVLKPLDATVEGMKSFKEDTTHFVATKGMGSLVKHVLTDLPPSAIYLNYQVSSIRVVSEKIVVTSVDGKSEEADIVISTIPVPQFLKLEGALTMLSDVQLGQLQNVKYSSRFVLIWFYKSAESFPFPTWGVKYLDDEVFRYVAFDNIKRNQEGPPAVVFHTSVQFGAENADRAKDDLAEELEKRASLLFPEWPKPDSSKCHKWLYSQVTNTYRGEPGCLVIRSHPTIILAGDAFSASNFNGCIASAQSAVDAALKHL